MHCHLKRGPPSSGYFCIHYQVSICHLQGFGSDFFRGQGCQPLAGASIECSWIFVYFSLKPFSHRRKVKALAEVKAEKDGYPFLDLDGCSLPLPLDV